MQTKLILKRTLSLILLVVLMMTMAVALISTVSAAEVTLASNTRIGLQEEINKVGTTPTIIQISASFSFDKTVVQIPANANITIKSNTGIAGAPFTLTQTSGRHFNVSGSLTLEDIVLNGSPNGTINTASGGGVSVASTGSFTMKNGAAIQYCFTTTNGGGIYANTGGTITIAGGTINANKATANGGGVYGGLRSAINISGGEISDNIASHTDINGYGGGGVYANGSVILMTGGKITRNSNSSRGGGVMLNENATFSMTGGEISGNSTKTAGGGIYGKTINISGGSLISNNNSTLLGGGIYGIDGSQVTIGGDAEISGNYVVPSDTALYGGGIAMDSNSKLTLKDRAVIKNCSAPNGGGVCIVSRSVPKVAATTQFIMQDSAEIKDCDASQNGGGVYVYRNQVGNDFIFTLAGGEISGNTSTYGSGVYLKDSSLVMGVTGGNHNSVFIKNNTASYMGGGVDAHDGSKFTMYSGTISGNKSVSGGAITYGGGVEVYGGSTFALNDGLITNNESTGESGGVEVYDNSMFTMQGGSITNNASASGGGVGVGSNNAKFTMTGGTISGNSSIFGGGGVYMHNSGIVTVTSGSITNNNGEYGGGILANISTKIDVDNCSITDNKALVDGGGIYTIDTSYSNLEIGQYTNFSNNTAETSFVPPGNLDAMYPNIRYGNVSAFDHPLNNYDINTAFTASPICHITFDSQGGSGVSDQKKNFGQRVDEPDDPIKTGYEFLGWFDKDINGDFVLWNFNTILVIEEHGIELVLYAGWDVQETMISGTVIGLPNNSGIPIWYSNNGGIITNSITTDGSGNYSILVLYDSPLFITPSDQTGYHAKPKTRSIIVTTASLTGNDFIYSLDEYTVKFDSNDGSQVADQPVLRGGTVTQPTAPTKQGNTFAGWYIDNETFQNAWNFDTNIVIEDMTLYANWTKISESTIPTSPSTSKRSSRQAPTEYLTIMEPNIPLAKEPTTNPSTGDYNKLGLWLILLCTSLVSIVYLFCINRIKKREANDN